MFDLNQATTFLSDLDCPFSCISTAAPVENLASATCAIAGLTLVALLVDHKVLVEYRELARGPYAQVIPSGITTPIRKLLEEAHSGFSSSRRVSDSPGSGGTGGSIA